MNTHTHTHIHTDTLILNSTKQNEFFTSQLNGAYWGLTCLDLMHELPKVDTKDMEDTLAFIWGCSNGRKSAFGGNVGHDAHLLYTLSAIQILALYDRLDDLDRDAV